MAKGNMLLGHSRGKVGSLVFSRSNGVQIVRARAEVVKNPQTELQMIQRIVLNTIAQAYSGMKTIVDHSFEGIAPGQESMSYFMKRNMDSLRAKIASQLSQNYTKEEIVAFTPIGANFFTPNDYEISKGTLPEIQVENINDDGAMAFPLRANTYQDVLNRYGLKRGDQLTFIGVQGTNNTKFKFFYARVILDPRDSDGNELGLGTIFVDGSSIANPSPRNEGNFRQITFETDKVKFNFEDSYMVAGAVIVSRQAADGSWLRSNATLTANADSGLGFYNLQQCLDMLQGDEIASFSSRYLNNAGTTRIPTGSENNTGGDVPGGGDAPGGGGDAGEG